MPLAAICQPPAAAIGNDRRANVNKSRALSAERDVGSGSARSSEPSDAPISWADYGRIRNLSRNRLLWARHAELVEHYLATFGKIDNDTRVLDIGPANGFFMVLLRELGFEHVTGLEISPTFVEVLRRKGLNAVHGNVLNAQGFEALSPPYDAITMMEVLEHIESPLDALRNVRRIVADDGLLFLTVPMCDCIFDRIRRVFSRDTRRGQILRIDETHLHAFDAESIRKLLTGSGFRVERMTRVSMVAPRIPSYYPGRRSALLLRSLVPTFLKGYFLSALARPVPQADITL